MLPKNYCVYCGNHITEQGAIIESSYLCLTCLTRGVELPTQYLHTHNFHCSYCNEILDRYFDFTVEGAFKSDDYLCIGCSFIHENFDRNRVALPEALTYMENATPKQIHIQQAYDRQYRLFHSGFHIV